MNERPILFSAPMVRAILDGRKTQTRRILKDTTEHKGPYNPKYLEAYRDDKGWKEICPHGKIGDRLWVRETWGLPHAKCRCKACCEFAGIKFRADGEDARIKWTPSIFMPRIASRIILEITEIRVQRVREISEEDAEAEGCKPDYTGFVKEHFADLWDSINFKIGFGWEINPWVWAISFKRIKP
jgi:hypothetical protein